MTLEGNVHVLHHCVVRVPRRDRVLRRLRDSGIGAAVHYSAPIHLHPSFSYLGHREGDFPASEDLCRSILSLPMFPTISERQQERVVETLASSLR
jgi:dTDP-4-amino-4,6-dideoxygalactose transaminase